MAGQAEGGIVIDTVLDTKGLKAGSAEMKAAIKSLTSKVSDLQRQMQKVGQQKIETKAFSEVNEDIKLAEKNLDSYRAQLGKLDAAGKVGTEKWKETKAEIAAVEAELQRLKDLRAELEMSGNAFISGTETAEYEKLAHSADVVSQRLREMRQEMQEHQNLETYQGILSTFEEIEQKLSSINLRGEEGRAQLSAVREELAELQARISEAVAAGADSSQYEKLKEDIQTVINEIDRLQSRSSRLSSIGNAIGAAFRGVGNTLKGIVVTAGKLVSKLGQAAVTAAKRLGNAIKSAAFHMASLFARGRATNGQFKGMSRSLKMLGLSVMGVRSTYYLLRHAVSSFMEQNQELSNKLSGIERGIGNVMGPIITRIINLVATAVSYITAFLKLFGVMGKSATKAINSAGGAAAGAAKELKRQLASFDELNILSGSDSGSGGGGGGGADFSADLPDAELPDWAKLMVEQLKKGDWAAAATTLVDQLNKMVAGVDWAGLGNKIGYYLNGALTFLATFIKKFDWLALGKNLGTMLNSIITSVDWGKLGTILAAKLTVIPTIVAGTLMNLDWGAVAYGFTAFATAFFDHIREAIAAIDWGKIAQGIATFLKGVNWYAIGNSIAGSVNALVQAVSDIVTNFDWTGTAQSLVNGLNSLIKSVDWKDLGSTLGTAFHGVMMFILSAIGEFDWGAAVSYLLDCIRTFIEAVDWMELAVSLATCFNKMILNVDWSEVGATLSDAITGFLDFILHGLAMALSLLRRAKCCGLLWRALIPPT